MELLGLVDVPTWIVLVIIASLLAYFWGHRNHYVWKERGVPGPKPWCYVGTIPYLVSKGIEKYDEYMLSYGRVSGAYESGVPTLYTADIDILRDVMVKQFDCFVNRSGLVGFEAMDTVANRFLTLIKDDDWRNIRNQITPAFTTGKLKRMFPGIQNAAQKLQHHMIELSENDGEFTNRDLFGAYTMDVIAFTAFGIELNSQKEPNSPFIKHAKTFFDIKTPIMTLVLFLPSIIPFLSKIGVIGYLQKRSAAYAAENFFREIVEQIMRNREKGVKAKSDADFVQLCLNALAENDSKNEAAKGMTLDDIHANAILFFVAGYETTATTLTYLAYNLALHPDIQDRLLEEIDELYQNGDDLDYERVSKASYIDQCLEESMRIYPPVGRLERLCNQDVVSNGFRIHKGDKIAIPVTSIQHNPQIFPEPKTFNPERFSAENKQKREQLNWLPFGAGPRNCIGKRLALLEIRVAIATILRTHRFVATSNTPKSVTFKLAPVLTENEPILLKLEPRK